MLPEHWNPQPISADDVLALVARHTGISVEEIRGRSQTEVITYARHLVLYLLRGQRYPYTTAAEKVGGRERTTASAGVKRITSHCRVYPNVAADVLTLEAGVRHLEQHSA